MISTWALEVGCQKWPGRPPNWMCGRQNFCTTFRLSQQPRHGRNVPANRMLALSGRKPARTALHNPIRIFCSACQERSEEHTSELQSLMRISYAVFCLKKKTEKKITLKIATSTNTQ